MKNILVGRGKGLAIAAGLALLALCAILLARKLWSDARAIPSPTPEATIEALNKAGFEVSNLRETDSYPGPVARGERAIEFNILVEGETCRIHLTQYANDEDSNHACTAINKLDRQMQGGYAYAFSRGRILVQVFPSSKNVADKLEVVIRGIK